MTIKLDTLLSYVLIIFFILSFGLYPKETPYWFFGLIFLALLAYLFLDISKIKPVLYEKAKNLILWLLIISIIVGSSFSTIFLRHLTYPTFQVHDIVVQQESAIRYLLKGKNPYSETYFGTPLEKWHYSDNLKEKNPALWHFVMEPLYLLFSIPFYILGGRLLGFFDGRFPLIFLILTALFFAFKSVKDGEKRRSFILLLALNPLMAAYNLEGRSDFFMLGFLMPALYFLFKEKFRLSAVFMAFAFAVKQSVWPIFPFYFAYLLFKEKKGELIKTILIFTTIFTIIVLPFFLWNPRAFINSTIFYLSGNTIHAYPISGYGFGMLLNQFQIIKNVNDKFPFVIFQILIGVPLFFYLLNLLKKNITVKVLILVYAIFLFVFWYFSRYFNNSHIAYLTILFTSAYFWPEEKTLEKVR